jgi:aspartyl protease family protein
MLSCHHKRNKREIRPRDSDRKVETTRNKTVVKMRKEGGVYHIPCKINGSEMEFIFDTGASDIIMSLTEAMFLYKQKKLSDNDFFGVAQYQIANGSIAEGTVVNLRSVMIGNKTLNNVKASIIHNTEAPLLLGQSALAKFGKISIDYKKNEITFE